jgi:FkbM family methyltransferase
VFSAYLSILRQIWCAPGNASNRPLAALRAFRWFIACHRKTGPDKTPVLLPVFGNRVYPCYTDSIIAKDVMYRSEWFDRDLLFFMRDFLRSDDHFVDVGANTGLHTILASTRIAAGRITCVEADPKNAARLRYALALNHITNATILPVAASDAPGRTALDGGDVFTRMSPDSNPLSDERSVETSRLDTALGPGARVDFCKIDVEGAEWQVLKGMTGLMERNALPAVAFEFNGLLRDYGHTEEGFLSWLRDRGYSAAAYDHDRRTLAFGDAFSANAGDLFAFTERGRTLVEERMPDVQIVEGDHARRCSP